MTPEDYLSPDEIRNQRHLEIGVGLNRIAGLLEAVRIHPAGVLALVATMTVAALFT